MDAIFACSLDHRNSSARGAGKWAVEAIVDSVVHPSCEERFILAEEWTHPLVRMKVVCAVSYTVIGR